MSVTPNHCKNNQTAFDVPVANNGTQIGSTVVLTRVGGNRTLSSNSSSRAYSTMVSVVSSVSLLVVLMGLSLKRCNTYQTCLPIVRLC